MGRVEMEDRFVGMESPEVLRIHLGRGTNGELMTGATVDACLALLAASDLTIVDLDGPPPELHPRFQEMVILVRALRRRVLHRCNLAVVARPEHEHLPELLADHRVDVVVSLPGRPARDPIMPALLQALRRLSSVGYGQPGSGLRLDLVVPSLPRDGEPSMGAALEASGLSFSGLHLVSPPARSSGDLVADLQRLAGAIPAARVLGVPCRSSLSVDWDGALSEAMPLGRTVHEVRSLDEALAPMVVPATMSVGALEG
jgi:hypothetical protein